MRFRGNKRLTCGQQQPIGDKTVLKTITLGTCVSVQGVFVRALQNGKIVVRVGDRSFTGHPVSAEAA